MVVPSGPGLATIDIDADYYRSLLMADFALPDSGLMVLLLKIFYGVNLTKYSGRKFLDELFKDLESRTKKPTLFLVDPNLQESNRNREYLLKRRIYLQEDCHYIAPMYAPGEIVDSALLNLLEKERPDLILINIGGGVQERLGAYLKSNLKYTPGIICTGAAIAFFTGAQAKIPDWVDKIYLGWLYRCIVNPKVFVPRYLKAFRLVWLMWHYRHQWHEVIEPQKG